MMTNLPIDVRFAPVLDPGFVPAVLWNRAYQAQVAEQGGRVLELALQRPDRSALRCSGEVLNAGGENDALTAKFVERLVKFLLWQKGGSRILVAGAPDVAEALTAT